jgi:monovalent cation:H+ antiporter-2, CPA2 family
MALEFESAGVRDALVVLGAAGIVIPAFARFRISPVIGFILVGILVGPFGLGALSSRAQWLEWVTISDPSVIAPFAEFGIILLLFSIGLDLSAKRLWSMRKRVLGFGGPEMLGSAALIALALSLTGQDPSASLGLGLALALSSTALVVPIAGRTTPVGRLAFSMLLFEDLALVPIIFVLGALAPSSAGDAVGLLETIARGVVAISAVYAAGRFLFPHLFAQAARTKSPELFLSASLLVIIVASLATAAAGLSPIVGALIAGVLIAETEYEGEISVIIAPFRGLALAVFLISIGMSLDFAMIATNWSAIFAAIIGIVAVKTIVTVGLLRIGGIRSGLATETGVLMGSPSETTLIVLVAAAQAHLIDTRTLAFWQVVTAVGLTITPLLARIGRWAAHRIEWTNDTRDQTPDSATELRTIIVGYGRVGQMVGEMLDVHNAPWIALDGDIDTVTEARRTGKHVRFGDASRAAVLESLSLDRADAVVLTMDHPAQLVRMTAWMRRHHPDLTIISRARDADHAARLYRAGATDAVPETLESSLQLSEAVLIDLGKAMGPVIASIHEKRDELRVKIKDQAGLEHAPRLGSLNRTIS